MVCPICAAEFNPHHSRQKYCSRRCNYCAASKRYYHRHKEAALLVKKYARFGKKLSMARARQLLKEPES